MWRIKRCAVLFFVLCGFSCCAKADITLEGARCGQNNCKLTEYCSDFDRTCTPCSEICNKSNHNFQRELCENKCQDYMHDIRYAKRGESGDNENLKLVVQKLSTMVSVTLTLVCFLLLILASLLCFQLYRWKVKKNITLASIKARFSNKQSDDNLPKTYSVTTRDAKSPELKLDMPTSIANSDDHSPVTVTTSISRRPAEDSTLDYSYDNPVMTKNNNFA